MGNPLFSSGVQCEKADGVQADYRMNELPGSAKKRKRFMGGLEGETLL